MKQEVSKKGFSESQIVKALETHFKREGFDLHLEVPSMGQSVDLVARKGRWLSFVEAKVNDWPKAFEQCRSHEIVADFIYIAIATKEVSSKLKERAIEKGYGIIHYSQTADSCSLYLKPKKNPRVWEPQRKILRAKLKKQKEWQFSIG